MPHRRTRGRPRGRRLPTPRSTTHNANGAVLTQEVIEQASQAALERGGSVSDPMFAAYGEQAETNMAESVQHLMRALEVGTYNAAPGNLQQGAPLQVEDLSDYTLDTTIQPINVLGRFEPVSLWDEYADSGRRMSRPAGRRQAPEVVEMREIIRGFRKDSK